MIRIPRAFVTALASVFSAYHVVLALFSLDQPRHPAPAVVALVLFAVATSATLWSTREIRMPVWLAAFDFAVCVAIPLLVTSQLDPGESNGYATWYVAAIGTLLTIVAVRRRQLFAWLGIGFLVLQTLLWTGEPLSLASLGVVGSAAWVCAAVVMTNALARAARDSRQFARVERQAAEWQAAQEAHLSERQYRLAHTYRLAGPLLSEIVRSGGELDEEQRAECRVLEAAMRDEIRGRSLLDDRVRLEVESARRRGATVTLLDEGGLDDLPAADLEELLRRLAAVIGASHAQRLIVRTVPRSPDVAITVVGLVPAGAGGQDDDEDDVELWLELGRPGAALSGRQAVDEPESG